MILNVLVILLLIAITLLWGMRGKGRGLFSSFLAFLCIVVAGAVAFGLWETLVYKFLLDMNEDMAWGLGLLIPFGVTLLIARVITDLAVPKNLDFGDVENFAGGAAFGLASGVITVGILVLSLSYFRMGPALLGYAPVEDKNGNLVYEGSLWVPVDKLTVAFYEHVSNGAFSTPTPLGRRMPALYEQAALQRMAYADKEGHIARHSIKGDQFEIRGRYQSDPASAASLAVFETLDATGARVAKNQTVLDSRGEPVSGNVRLEGFLIEFKAGAGEKSGQFVVGPGQVRLIVAEPNGDVSTHTPFSIIATPEAGSQMHRFPINANELFLPSVGGASTSYFSFEFLVPAQSTVQDLVVKNYRVPASRLPAPAASFKTAEARDDALRQGSLFESLGVTVGGLAEKDIDRSQSVSIGRGSRGDFDELTNNNLLPEGWVVATTTGTKGLDIVDKDKDRFVGGGQGTFTEDELRQKGLDRNLRVDRFLTKRDTSFVQVQIKSNGKATKLGLAVQASSASGPPRLIDSKNRTYEAIGWVYGDSGTVNIRFTPGDPLESLSELPSALSDTKRDQTLYLLFQPTTGVKIEGFLLGNTQIASFSGGLEIR